MRTSLKRALYMVTGPLLFLGGCRGVVGIHDLDVVADVGVPGSEGGVGATSDNAVSSEASGTDAASDGPVHVPIEAGCQSSTGMACGMCCRTAAVLMPAFGKLDQLAAQENCICGAGACSTSTECGTTVCVGSPSNGMCGGCVEFIVQVSPAIFG
jgi:hypothetical protein